MKLRVALLVTLVSLAGSACKKDPKSQPPTTQPGPSVDPWGGGAPPAKDPLKRPLFWSAEKAGKTTFLLGTMHVGVDPEARLPQLVWDKLDAAPTFAVETDVADRSLAGLGGRTSGTLREEIGPDYWKKLEIALTPQVAQQMDGKSALIPATMLALRGLPPTPPMDGVLLGRAMNQKKKIVYLEPASKQAAILEKHMNAKALKLILDGIDSHEAQQKQLLDAYVSGDEAKMAAIIEAQRKDALAKHYTAAEYEQSLEELLYQRNASWIAPIEKLHAGGGGFVAVGAMHLIGVKSVLELLQQNGYKITRIAP